MTKTNPLHAPGHGGRRVSPGVRRLVDIMDERFTVPGTDIRFGLDAIIGLVPGIGDFLGMIIGAAVIVEALRLKVPTNVLVRMLLNLWIDSFIGSVPVVGDAFDFYFKANRRNLALLEKHA